MEQALSNACSHYFHNIIIKIMTKEVQTIKLRIVGLLLTFIFFCQFGYSQDYADVRILKGGSLPFIVNSFSKYNNGVTLSDWTRLRLLMVANGQSGWELYVNATIANIQSDLGPTHPNLDLSQIEINVSVEDENDPTYALETLPITLAFDGVGYGSLIISGSNPGVTGTPLDVTILISYDLGTTTPLLNSEPGMYFVDLEYTLTSVP